jgi:hypothetical protein
MALAPDGVHLAVTNNGNGRQTIDLVNLQKKQLVSSVTIGKAWLGLTFSKHILISMPPAATTISSSAIILSGDSLLNKDTLTLGRPWPAKRSALQASRWMKPATASTSSPKKTRHSTCATQRP